MRDELNGPRRVIAAGRTSFGVELGSTRIKACLIGADHAVLATGGSDWENQLVDGVWTYSLDAVWTGLQGAVAALLADCERQHGVRPAAVGVSAMMSPTGPPASKTKARREVSRSRSSALAP